MTLLLSLILSSPALADDCDAKALGATLSEASPASVGKHFAALAACDEGAAKKRMSDALGKMIENEGAHAAVVAALALGGEADARGFVARLDPSESARTLGYLAGHCDAPGVTEFFVATRHDDPGTFFDGGWYRALATCRTEPSLALLADAMEDPAVKERLVRTQWTNLVATYARAAGPIAIPSLKSLASSLEAEADLVDVIGAFADAAQVGSSSGTDADGAAAAVAALNDLGPKLPPLAVEKARDTLTALGDESAANAAVVWRWQERIEGGKYTYGAVAVEDVTCKNGKRKVLIHTATVLGMVWPDQLEPQLGERLSTEWDLTAAQKCKGTGQVHTAFPSEPFADATTADAWATDRAKALRGDVDSTVKVEIIPHDTLGL
ncbi:MAG: hypothetical protein KC912_08150 [Proteobacteria bacterium]|nr:hypothetical protein [Pseudomonadota bacterium]